MVNKNYIEILRAFEEWNVEYLLVGAHAAAQYGYVRYTGDLELTRICEHKSKMGK